MTSKCLVLGLALFLAGCDGGPAPGKGPAPQAAGGESGSAAAPRPEPVAKGHGSWDEQARYAIDKGIRFLKENQVPGSLGRWRFNSKVPPDIGITGLALLGVMESKRGYTEADVPWVRDGIKWIVASQKEDGSIHAGMLATYNTSIAILALTATKNPAYRPVIDKAVEYLRIVQSDEAEGYQPGDRFYGGVAYGDNERPDLSNTHFSLEAAHTGGMKTDDAYWKKAIVFLQRSQNRSESNDLKDGDVVPGNDGGGFYSPAVGDREAKAGFITLKDGKKVRRSYGSMSYALLRSYLFCNLDVKDPRVQAVTEWLEKNYTVEHNPGMEGSSDKPEAKYAGLYYYYLTMARTLAAPRAPVLKDESGKPRNWREDLARAIVARQQADGSWFNDKNPQFWEGSAVLATSMAINALNACVK
jgi:squalene-hopene/tetraprenyl-beta-curcumene cyclase